MREIGIMELSHFKKAQCAKMGICKALSYIWLSTYETTVFTLQEL